MRHDRGLIAVGAALVALPLMGCSVTFTLTGSVTGGAGPGMSGNATYGVFTMDGSPAWTQVGTWPVARQ